MSGTRASRTKAVTVNKVKRRDPPPSDDPPAPAGPKGAIASPPRPQDDEISHQGVENVLRKGRA